MAENNKDYGPRAQIHKYQTSKKLLEFTNKLVPAEVDYFGNVHSQGGKGTIPSRIGLTLLDYSNGTGKSSISLSANISPSEVAFLLNLVTRGDPEVSFIQQKIIAAKKGNDGRAPVTKLEIVRTTKDKNGNERKLPWFVRITNGSGIPEESASGGQQCKPGSFQKEKEGFINLSDGDMFKALYETNTFIELWQIANVLPVIKEAQKKIAERYTKAS